MTYKIKSKNREIKHRATILRVGWFELENEAQRKFGSNYSELTEKEKLKISKDVAKHYNF